MTTSQSTVFVVDDEQVIRELTCDILEGQGYRVLSARNGREAVDMLGKDPETVDLVILDMSMPEMDGIQTFRAMREIRPDLKVLVSSGYTEDPSVKRLVAQGASGVLTKPFKIDELSRIIESTLSE